MGNLYTKLSNKVQYMISEAVSDPNADAFAKQQAQQAKQDAAVAENERKAEQLAENLAAENEASEIEAASLAARSKFSSPTTVAVNVINGVVKGFMALIFICIILYGGSLAVNKAIGYSIPFRLLTFIYGMIFSFWVIPKSLYDVYSTNISAPYYSFLPLSIYHPVGSLESFFLGPFCYKEDDTTAAARAAVNELYKNAFLKSGGTLSAIATTATTAVVSANAVINRKNSPEPSAPKSNINTGEPSAPKSNINTGEPSAPKSNIIEHSPEPSALNNTPDAPKPEAPKPESPKPESPKVEAPKPESPKVEAPKPESPKAMESVNRVAIPPVQVRK